MATKTLQTSTAFKPRDWLSIAREDSGKAIIWAALMAHALSSAYSLWKEEEDPSVWRTTMMIHLVIGFYAAYALSSELYFLAVVRPYLPPGPLGIPFLGSLLSIVAKKGAIGLFLMERGQRIQSSVFTTCFLQGKLFTLTNSDGVSWIVNNDRKSQVRVSWPPNISALLGPNAVSTNTGARHKRFRRLMEPFYSPRFVQNYVDVICKTTKEELAKWHATKGLVSGTVFKLYSLRLFLASSFGSVDEDILNCLSKDFLIWIQGFLVPTGTLRIPGGTFDKAMKARDRILAVCKELVDAFRSQHPEGSHLAETTVMGRMLYSKNEDGKGLNDDEILDNLLTLIFAGHDTTYASINTVLYHIAQNPKAMEALVDEVSSLKDPIDYEQLKNEAPVLNAIMHESWRVDPPVPFGFRQCVSQKGLEYKGYRFPKGSIFNYNILLAARNEALYPSADVFRFERFLPKDHPLCGEASCVDPAQGRSDYPIFGAGSHVCLGKNFAKMELRILLTLIFQNYKVTVANPQKLHAPVNCWALDFQLEERTKD